MSRTVTITDHALVRWLQRARGIDMEALRRGLAEQAQPFADACVKHAEVGGVWFVFDGPRLITVTPDKPALISTIRNDRGFSNKTNARSEGEMGWTGKKRRRNHK